MALTQFPLDGVSDGTAITTGNTGASTVSLGSGSTGAYAIAAKAYGTVGVRLSIATGTSPAFRFLNAASATNNQQAFRFCTSGPNGAAAGSTNAVNFVTFRHASGTVAAIGYDKGNNGINFRDGTSGTILAAITFAALTTAAGSTVNLATVLEYSLVINNSTGVWSLKAYLPGTSTVVWNASGASTFTSTAAFAGMQFGGSSDVTVTQDIDYVQLNDGASSEIGAPASNQLPTLTLTANQTAAAGAPVSVSATATDPDGTVASYAWSIAYPTSGAPSLTGASTATCSFTAGVAGSLYIVQCVVTDNSGGQTTKTTEVRVPNPASTVMPLTGQASGASGWGIVGSASDQGSAVSDSDGATMVESPDITGTASARRFRLPPMAARSALTITLRGAILTATGPTGCKARVGSGSTQHAEYTIAPTTSSSDITVPASPTDQATLAAAVTDWGAVWVELVAAS
jgi:hypothetical protein